MIINNRHSIQISNQSIENMIVVQPTSNRFSEAYLLGQITGLRIRNACIASGRYDLIAKIASSLKNIMRGI